jgi:hypothetical protein
MAGPVKLRRVGSGRQDHPDFVAMFGVLIVMLDAFANFSCSYPNNRVRVRIIVGGTVEDFDAEDALFQLVGLASERTRNHKPQEPRISLAGME